MSHSPATPSEWEPDAEATRPLPLEGQESDGAPGEPPAADAGDGPAETGEAPMEDPWPAEDPWHAVAEDPWDAPTDDLGEAPADDLGEAPADDLGNGPATDEDAAVTAPDAPAEDADAFADDAFGEEAPHDEAFGEASLDGRTPENAALGDITDEATPEPTQELPLFDAEPTAPLDPFAQPLPLTPDDAPGDAGPSEPPLTPDDAPGDAGASEPPAGDAAPAGDDDSSSARKPLVFLAAGLAVLLIVVGIVWAVISTANTNRDKAIAQTATTYLSSIASGDAQAALATLADKPANTALLTGEVLTASRSTAPLTDIQVGTPVFDGGSAATVPASYRIGDQAVSTTLHLEGDGRTQWLISDGTADLTLSSTAGLTVNSAKVTEGTNPVFPGSYTVATGTDNVSIEGTPQAVVASPDAEPTSLDVTAVLSETGQQNVLTAVKTRFDECLASTEARPADCPFGVRTDDVEVTPGSVKFALVNDPWAGFAPTLDAANLSATGPLAYVIDATATVSQNGLTTEGTTRLERAVAFTVDLTKDPLVVVWS